MLKNNLLPNDGHDALPSELLESIRNFDKRKLISPPVYFVNRNTSGYRLGPKAHGFIAVGAPGKKGVHTYSFDANIMGLPFTVSEAAISRIKKEYDGDKTRINIIEALSGQTFQSTEQFCRSVLLQEALEMEKAANNNAVLTEEEKHQIIDNTSVLSNVARLAFLNDELNKGFYQDLRSKFGPVILVTKLKDTFLKHDRRVFEDKKLHFNLQYERYLNVDSMILHDLAQSYKLYTYYMYEKAGIGQSTPAELKDKVTQTPELREKAEAILSSMPSFMKKPHTHNPKTANCNKAAATLLQLAENLSAEKQKRKPQTVKALSIFAVGATQRMFFWDPLKQNSIKKKEENLPKTSNDEFILLSRPSNK